MTYVMTVVNDGPSAATGVTLVDVLPGAVNYVSSTAGQGACSGTGTISCALGTLASGASVAIQVAVDPTATGTIANTASVTSDVVDPDPADNPATATTTVVGVTDLTLSKIGTPDSILAGNILTYVLTVSNTGSSAATGVTVLDTLPIEVSYVSRTAQQGFCSGTTTISCSLGTLGVGAITTITNTATVTGNETDPDSSNNTATSTTAVNIEVDVSLSPGYNLICIPVAFAEPFRARDLGKSLLPEGTQIEDGPVTAVLQWDGAYTFWLSSNPADNNYAL